MIDVFLQTCDWLEDRVVQSLRDFMEKMREYAGKVDLEVYDKRYIKSYYRDIMQDITFSEETGKPSLLFCKRCQCT